MDKNMTLEQRVERLEKFLERVITVAEQHPMGKSILKMLGV